VLTISQASQALARVRGETETHVWAIKRGLVWAANRSTDAAEIKQWYQSNYEVNSKYLGSFVLNYSPLCQEFESPHFDLFCKNAAYRNACQSDFRELLRIQLQTEGYTVQSIHSESAGEEAIKSGLKASWQDVELQRVRAIGAAELLSESELSQRMNSSDRPSIEEQYQIEKALLYKQFGQEVIESMSYTHRSGEVFEGVAAAYLKNRQNKYQRELEAFRLLYSPTAEAALKDWEREEKQLRQSGERFAGDVRWLTSQKELRESLEMKSLQPGTWYGPSGFQLIVNRAREHAETVRNTLNCSTENLSDGQIVGELFRQIGLVFDERWMTPEDGGKRYKQRRINQESWDRAWQYVSYRDSFKVQLEPGAEPAPVTDSPVTNSDHPPVSSFSKAKRGGDQSFDRQPPISALSETAINDMTTQPIPLDETQTQDIAELMECCEDVETLSAIKGLSGMHRSLWQSAARLLSQERRQQIWKWAEQLLDSGQSPEPSVSG